MTTASITVKHVRVESDKGFTEVTKSFEDHIGRFDSTVFDSIQSSVKHEENLKLRIEAMAGISGFMLFNTTDHGKLLSYFGKGKKAIQYVVGNPLIAMQMTQHNLAAGLYAPLRVLIYENEQGKTCLEYDQPSSLFSQFDDDRITSVALMLDHKLDGLVAAAIS